MTDSNGTAPFAGASEIGLPVPPFSRFCRCDDCKYQQGPRETGNGALLYCGPGITEHTWQTRVRNGQWDDIPAEFDAAATRVHLAARNGQRQIHRDLDGGMHHLAAMFSAEPDVHFHAQVAEGLHQLEAGLAAQLDEMVARARVAELDVAAERYATETVVAA